jgi:hypothetical protein
VTALRAGNWLADAVSVIDALDLTSYDEVRRIAPLLGLAAAEGRAIPPAHVAEPAVAVPQAAEPPRPVSPAAPRSRPTRLRDLSQLALPSLEPVATQPAREPAPGPDVPVLAPESHGGTPPMLPFRPLLRRRTAAGILAAAVRTWGPGSRIDERRTVAELARARPIREFPLRPRLSVYRGVQVLIDLGEALDPYGRDQQDVVGLALRVVGPEATTVGSFENCPSRGVWMLRHAAMAPGRPVLVLTDLGLGGPLVQPARASAAEWCRYAKRMTRAGSPTIALVPYPLTAADRVISRRIAVVAWDRASVSAVQRARRRAS